MSSMAQARQEAVNLVELDYPVKQVDDFYWFSLEETYFSMSFFDDQGGYRYALINRDGGDITYYEVDEIISQGQAYDIAMEENELIEIKQVRLGMIDDRPVWEVTYEEQDESMTYYYINAESGNWIQTIENL